MFYFFKAKQMPVLPEDYNDFFFPSLYNYFILSDIVSKEAKCRKSFLRKHFPQYYTHHSTSRNKCLFKFIGSRGKWPKDCAQLKPFGASQSQKSLHHTGVTCKKHYSLQQGHMNPIPLPDDFEGKAF